MEQPTWKQVMEIMKELQVKYQLPILPLHIKAHVTVVQNLSILTKKVT